MAGVISQQCLILNVKILLYTLSQLPDAQLVQQALIKAIAKHRPNTRELLFHSDQGVQYMAGLFKDTLSLHSIKYEQAWILPR